LVKPINLFSRITPRIEKDLIEENPLQRSTPVEDKTVALRFRNFRDLAAGSKITARPESHQAFHVYLDDRTILWIK
jgi:hypothetical protein